MSLKYLLSILLLAGLVFLACSKNDDLLDENDRFYFYNPKVDAQVKFVNSYVGLTPAAVTASAAAASGPGFRIFVDGQKIDGSTNASSTTNVMFYGNQFPATTAYTTLSPGQRSFKFTINRISGGNFAPIAGDEVFNLTTALASDKKYTFFLADTVPTPSVFVIEDKFKEPVPNTYGLRFLNLSPEPSKRYDFVSKRHGVKFFSNVGYKEIKDFIYITTTTTDTMFLLLANTNTIVSQVNSFNPVTQRVYTFYARGKTGVANRAPNLNFYTNR